MRLSHFVLPFLLLFIFKSQAQIPNDKQWYITPSDLREAYRVYNPRTAVPLFTPRQFSVENEDHPLFAPDNVDIPRNDFFVIYSNDYDIFYHEAISNDYDEGYNFDLANDVEYMYVTNAYEDDAPEGRIAGGGGGPGPAGFYNVENVKSKSPDVISFNQDIIKNVDVTVIINRKDLYGCTYNLCFDELIVNEPSMDAVHNLDISLANVFDNGMYNVTVRPPTITGNCLNGLVFPDSDPTIGIYSYIALHFGEVNKHIGESLKFTLEKVGDCPDNPNVGTSFENSNIIGDSHDPNFIQVLCVSTNECGKQYVHYRMECMNDEDTAVLGGDLSMTMVIPDNCVGPIMVKKWFINSEPMKIYDENFTGPNIHPSYDQSTNIVSFNFDNRLEGQSSAWVEFCVEYTGVDIESDNLQPSHPHTSFGTTLYAIQNFIDPGRAESTNGNYESGNIGDLPNMDRTTDEETCNCDPECEPLNCWQRFLKWLSNLF